MYEIIEEQVNKSLNKVRKEGVDFLLKYFDDIFILPLEQMSKIMEDEDEMLESKINTINNTVGFNNIDEWNKKISKILMESSLGKYSKKNIDAIEFISNVHLLNAISHMQESYVDFNDIYSKAVESSKL